MPPRDFVPKPVFLQIQELPGASKKLDKNISSFISAKNEERLRALVNRANERKDDGANQQQVVKKESKDIHTVPTKVAEGALLGFKPFGNDDAKQERYTLFLKDIIERANSKDAPTEKILTEEEAAETREFSKAAMLYRPLADMISQRFTSTIDAPMEQKKEPKVFGEKTRSVLKWQPSKVLCQRFAVRYVEDSDVEDEEKPDIEPLNAAAMASLFKERDMMMERGETNNLLEDTTQTEILTKDDMLAELHAGFNITNENETTAEKPGMALFEAIFADSEDDEIVEQKELQEPVQDAIPLPENEVLKLELPKNVNPSDYFSSTAIKPAPTITKSLVADESFRPVFNKSATKKQDTERKRKPKVNILSFDDEEDIVAKPEPSTKKTKVRPSAADYM